MSEPIANVDPQLANGVQGEEPHVVDPGQSAESGSEAEWSINEVPEEHRGEVEKAIKSYQSVTTPKLQKMAELEKKVEEGTATAQEYQKLQTDMQGMKQQFARLVTDDGFRNQLRQRAGINQTPTNMPEGWNTPEAVQARDLLMNDFNSQFQKATGMSFQQLQQFGQQAKTASEKADRIEIRNNQREYNQVKETLTKEGKPFNDEIFHACLGIITENTRKGSEITLRQAYDQIFGVVSDYQNKLTASQDKTKLGAKTFQPGGLGGEKPLKGDQQLMQIIDNLPGLDGVGWSG